jgi:hypothetical protein
MNFPASVKKGAIFRIHPEFISYSLLGAWRQRSNAQNNKDTPRNETHPYTANYLKTITLNCLIFSVAKSRQI